MRWQDPEGDVRAIKSAAYAAFGCTEPFRFNYSGHDLQLNASRHGNRVGANMRVFGHVYGLRLGIGERAGNAGPAPPDWPYDPRIYVTGAPKQAIRCLLDPEIQGICADLKLHLRADKRGLKLLMHSQLAGSPEYLQRAAYVGVRILQGLPGAIQAAGLGDYLAAGSLATHPETAAYRKRERARNRRATLLGVGCLLIVAAMTVAIVVVSVLF